MGASNIKSLTDKPALVALSEDSYYCTPYYRLVTGFILLADIVSARHRSNAAAPQHVRFVSGLVLQAHIVSVSLRVGAAAPAWCRLAAGSALLPAQHSRFFKKISLTGFHSIGLSED